MPRIDLDLSDVQDFSPIEDGTQLECEVSDFGKVQTAQSGAKYLNTTFTVTDGDFTGRKIFRNFMLTGKGASFTREFILKATGQELPKGENVSFDTDDVLGSRVLIVVKNEEYQGEERPTPGKILAIKKPAKATRAK